MAVPDVNYNPMNYAIAQANVVGGVAANINSAVNNVITEIPKIVKQEKAREKTRQAYTDILNSFADTLTEINPNISREQAIIKGRHFYKYFDAFSPEENIKMMVLGEGPAQNFLTKEKTTGEAQRFMGAAQQPIMERRQVQAEGPPISAEAVPERAGEFPMEMQETRMPMGTEQYESELAKLSPEAQKLVPESLGKQVARTEEVFQQPLKAFEEERTAQRKQREANIKTMTGISKDTGFHTSIYESKSAVKSLQKKQKILNKLVDTVIDYETPDQQQIGSGKQTDLELEIQRAASELNIPQQLADDKDFLAKMNSEINRLIAGEEEFQERITTGYEDWKKREAEKLRLKRLTASGKGKDVGGDKLQKAIKDMARQQFPSLFKVVDGEYGIEVLKKTSGIVEATMSILRDPKKRIAFAYAYPDETGKVARQSGAAKPSEAEIQAVLDEMNQLQNQVYGAIGNLPPSTTTGEGAPAPAIEEEDIFSGLGNLY